MLENHHVSSVFAILNQDSYNIFANFSREDYKMIRERIVSIVLATDMSIHFSDIAKLKGRLAAGIFPFNKIVLIFLLRYRYKRQRQKVHYGSYCPRC